MKKQRAEIPRRISINEEAYDHAPDEPSFALQMLAMRREEQEKHLREKGQTSRYEKLDSVYVSHPSDDDLTLLENPDETINTRFFAKHKGAPYRAPTEHNKKVPYSLRFQKSEKKSKDTNFKVSRSKVVPQLIDPTPTEQDDLMTRDHYVKPVASKVQDKMIKDKEKNEREGLGRLQEEDKKHKKK